MSILQDILDKALQTFDDKSPEAFDKLMEQALGALPAKEGLDTIPLGARNGAEEAIKLLQKRKPDLIHLGRFGLVAVLSKMAIGRTDEAVDLFLRKEASLADLLTTSLGNDAQAIGKKAELEAAKKKALEILREIGALTARYALPLLLGVI